MEKPMNNYATYVTFQVIYIILGLVVCYWIWEIRCAVVNYINVKDCKVLFT